MLQKCNISSQLIFALYFVLCIPSGHLFSHSRSHYFRFTEDNSSSEESTSDSDSRDSSISSPNIHKHTELIKPVHEDEGLREILCPGTGSILSRYDLMEGKCAEIDSQNHCGLNMIFKEESDSSSYGYCECDFENHNAPLVFHLPTKACYPVYQQGYCKPGEWLVLSKEKKGPVCQKKLCSQPQPDQLPMTSARRSKLIFPSIWGNEADSEIRKFPEKYENKKFLVPLNGTGPCVTLGEHSKFCDANEKVIITSDDIFPRCTVPGKSLRRLSIIPNACPPGSYYSIIGYCQPVWDF